MPRIKIDAVEWDDANEFHATRHGVSISEIEAVLARATVAYRNRKGRSGTTTSRNPRRVDGWYAWCSPTATAPTLPGLSLRGRWTRWVHRDVEMRRPAMLARPRR